MSRGNGRGVRRRGRSVIRRDRRVWSRLPAPRRQVFRFINVSAIESGRFVPHVNIAVLRSKVVILAAEVDEIDRLDVALKVHGAAPVDRDFSHHLSGICKVEE